MALIRFLPISGSLYAFKQKDVPRIPISYSLFNISVSFCCLNGSWAGRSDSRWIKERRFPQILLYLLYQLMSWKLPANRHTCDNHLDPVYGTSSSPLSLSNSHPVSTTTCKLLVGRARSNNNLRSRSQPFWAISAHDVLVLSSCLTMINVWVCQVRKDKEQSKPIKWSRIGWRLSSESIRF